MNVHTYTCTDTRLNNRIDHVDLKRYLKKLKREIECKGIALLFYLIFSIIVAVAVRSAWSSGGSSQHISPQSELRVSCVLLQQPVLTPIMELVTLLQNCLFIYLFPYYCKLFICKDDVSLNLYVSKIIQHNTLAHNRHSTNVCFITVYQTKSFISSTYKAILNVPMITSFYMHFWGLDNVS